MRTDADADTHAETEPRRRPRFTNDEDAALLGLRARLGKRKGVVEELWPPKDDNASFRERVVKHEWKDLPAALHGRGHPLRTVGALKKRVQQIDPKPRKPRAPPYTAEEDALLLRYCRRYAEHLGQPRRRSTSTCEHVRREERLAMREEPVNYERPTWTDVARKLNAMRKRKWGDAQPFVRRSAAATKQRFRWLNAKRPSARRPASQNSVA